MREGTHRLRSYQKLNTIGGMGKLGHPAKDLLPDGLKRLRKARQNNLKTLRAAAADMNMDPDAPLDAREQRFVWLIVEKGLPNPVAYQEAGYRGGPSTACEKAKQPKIAKAIAVLREKMLRDARITKKQVIDGFLDSIQCAKLVGEPIAMVAGWREVARVCGFYDKDVKKIDITVNGQLQLERLQAIPREQLLAMVEGREIEGEFTDVTASTESKGQREQPEQLVAGSGDLPEEGGSS